VAARYLERIVLSLPIAYAIGGLIHFILGFGLHYIITTYGRRKRFFGNLLLVFFVLSLAAIFLVFWARLQDLIARGRDPLTAFLQSFFVMLLEIVLPSLFGWALARYSLEREEVEKHRLYHRRWLEEMGRTPDPSVEWIEEVLRLEEEMRRLDAEITGAKSRYDISRLEELQSRRQWLEEKASDMKRVYPGDFDAALARWRATHPQEQQGRGEGGQTQG
jgi:signal transduction histidine kinase